MNTPQHPAHPRKAPALREKSAKAFRQKCRRAFPIALLLLALAACSTRKHAVAEAEDTPASSAATSEEARKMLQQQSLSWEGSYSSKARFNFTLGQKDFSLTGTLRLKRDEALQISLQVPLIGTEAVRIEANPERIVIIDRIHKRYLDEPVEYLAARSGTGLDFYALQALFSATLFQPGLKGLTPDQTDAMKSSTRAAGNIYRLSTAGQGLDCAFDIDATSQRIASTSVAKKGSRHACTWQYAGYETTGTRAFPTRIKVQFNWGETPLTLEVALNKLEVSDWKSDATPSSRYQRVEPGELLKLLPAL